MESSARRMVAGEAWGDPLGGLFLHGMRQRWPTGSFFIGPADGAPRVRTLVAVRELAVRGYAEVLRHYREIVGI
jgi:lipid-A-disaccharide synthase